ncbi:hypothetical protein MBLNU230_g5425t1 [Neophaeotheca triangularis]
MPNAKDPAYLRYRTWGRALAERRSNDKTKRISTQKRDARLRVEFSSLDDPARRAVDDSIRNLQDYEDLATLADQETRRNLHPTPIAEWRALSDVTNRFQQNQDAWQTLVDQLEKLDKTFPPKGLQSSGQSAAREISLIEEERALVNTCQAALQEIRREAPYNLEAPPSYDDMLVSFDKATADKEELSGMKKWPRTGDNWVGEGNEGSVYVYIRKDENGRITDRLAVKRKKVGPGAAPLGATWQGGDAVGRKRLAEAWHHSMASRRHRGRNNIVAFRNWTQTDRLDGEADTDLFFKIYLSFCPYGNLDDLIRNHEQLGRAADPAGLKKPSGEQMAAMIPENFIWSAFQGLVTAACVLRHGRKPGWGDGWDRHLAHLDIKPENVCLSVPRSDSKYPNCPNVELADFGHAADIVDKFLEGAANPTALTPLGTPDWCAPEEHMYPTIDTASPEGHRLESYSDIWGIGITIMGLMNLDNPLVGTKRFPPFDLGFRYRLNDPFPNELQDPAGYPVFQPWAHSKYSQALKSLVLKCLDANPNERPRADDLYAEILTYVQDPAFNKDQAGTGVSIEEGGLRLDALLKNDLRKFALPADDVVFSDGSDA